MGTFRQVNPRPKEHIAKRIMQRTRCRTEKKLWVGGVQRSVSTKAAAASPLLIIRNLIWKVMKASPHTTPSSTQSAPSNNKNKIPCFAHIFQNNIKTVA
jgi:hypothetical protein